jgi:hypothetical protein
LKDTKLKTGGDFQIESRMDLVWVSKLNSRVGFMLGETAFLGYLIQKYSNSK